MTVATMLALAWPAGILAAGWRWRPRRLLMLDPAAPESASVCSSDKKTVGPAHRMVRRFGAVVHRRADLHAGLAAVVAVFLAVASPWFLALVPIVWWVLPRIRRGRLLRAGDAAVRDELPLVADLFVLAAGAGLTVPLAVAAVAHRTTGPLGAALSEAARRTALGQHPADALEGVVDDAGEALRPLVTVLVAAERYGTPLVGPLERISDDVRRQRRRHAEDVARRVPVKLLFPLVLCTLPAFALLTVVPLLVSALGGLSV